MSDESGNRLEAHFNIENDKIVLTKNNNHKRTDDLLEMIALEYLFGHNNNILEINFKNYLQNNPVYLTSEQLIKLKKDGFGIASHGWDHPLYNQLSLEQQIDNTQKSLDYMTDNQFLNDSFAFPFTDHLVTEQFFDLIFKQNSDLKYTFGAAGLKLDSYSKNIQRIPIETKNYSAEEILKNEIIYYQVLKMLGKNTIKRS